MRILLIGASGTIGVAVAQALAATHEVLSASRSKSPLKVDLMAVESLKQLLAQIGRVDAIVSTAGEAAFRPLLELSDADFSLGLTNKLMGQVNLVRHAVEALTDGGSFTLTSGILSRQPMVGGAAISLVNGGLEAFAHAAALELPRSIRINVVAPGWVTETLKMLKMDTSTGTSAAEVAQTYVKCVEGDMTGEVFEALRKRG